MAREPHSEQHSDAQGNASTGASATAMKRVALGLGLVVVYALLGTFSLQWATVKGAGGIIWLPVGVATAALLYGGSWLWPAVFAGRLLTSWLTGSELPFWAELVIAAGNAGTTVLGVWLFKERDGAIPRLSNLDGMLRFLLRAAVLPSLAAALIGTLCLFFAVDLPADKLPLLALRWVFANCASVMVITGVILAMQQERLGRKDWPRFVLMMAASAATAHVVFATGPQVPLMTWHIYPVLIWAAISLRMLGATFSLLIVEATAIFGVLTGIGPFIQVNADPANALFYLQQFLVLTAVTVLLLSAVADERRGKAALEQAQRELRDLNEALETKVRERTESLRQSERALLQAQKMEALGQLTGGIAHDFNNLLQVVNTSFEVISRQPEAAAQVARMAQTGKRATLKGAKLTRQLLAFSRQQDLEMQTLHVATLLQNMTEMLQSTIGSGIRLNLDVSRSPHAHVFTDPTQFELMIINLVVNARDAMPGGGSLHIEVSDESRDGDEDMQAGRYVRISVRDTGHGMTREVAGRVFEPFFTTKGPGRGTGLGLSMVYGVAKQSGGKVEVVSLPDAGSTFAVLLPSVSAVTASKPRAEEVAALPRRLHVLLVDDDHTVREVVREMLVAMDLQVREADSAMEALSQIEVAPPDVILLDHNMPDMTGAALARRLVDKGHRMAIVLASGDGHLNEMPVPEPVVLLAKPYDAADLRRALARALERAHNL